MIKSSFAMVALAVGFGGANAAAIQHTRMSAQPQINIHDGSVEGCGIRVISTPEATATSPYSDVVDISFNMYAAGVGLVKGGVIRFNEADFRAGKVPAPRPLRSFWIKAMGKRATVPDEKGVTASKSPAGYLLYGTDTEMVADLFRAVSDKQQIMIGTQQVDQDVETIHAAIVDITPPEQKQVSDCLDELFDRMKESLQDPTEKPATGR